MEIVESPCSDPSLISFSSNYIIAVIPGFLLCVLLRRCDLASTYRPSQLYRMPAIASLKIASASSICWLLTTSGGIQRMTLP